MKLQGARNLHYDAMVPTRTGNPGKWENFFQAGKSQGILNRLEKSGNFIKKKKYWKSEEISPKILEDEGIVASFYFIIFLDFNWKCVC